MSSDAAPVSADNTDSGDAGRGGFSRGFGRGRGGRGRGGDRGRGGRGGRGGDRGDRGGRGGRGRRGDSGEKEGWTPVTKLGRLVKDGKIKSIEDIYLFSLPIKEAEIIDYFLKDIKDEVVKIMPVQKMTAAGQRTRFRAVVIVGDHAGHIGLGMKTAKEVATAIRGAIIAAKLNVIPVRRGWWGSRFGTPHTVPCKITGKCGSVSVRFVPAPRGAGLVCAPALKKILEFAGIQDVYTTARGSTKTQGNFVGASYAALANTFGYLTPEFWAKTKFQISPYQQYTDYLKDKKGKKAL